MLHTYSGGGKGGGKQPRVSIYHRERSGIRFCSDASSVTKEKPVATFRKRPGTLGCLTSDGSDLRF